MRGSIPFYVKLVVLSLAGVTKCLAPVAASWSPNRYGPDGPWNAVTVSVGSNKQQIDLLPGGTYQSDLLSVSVCLNASVGPSCAAKNAGLFDPSLSWTGFNYSNSDLLFQPQPDFTGLLPMGGAAYQALELVQIGHYGSQSVMNTSIEIVDNAYNTLPNGTQYPVTIGSLSLGYSELNQSFVESSPRINATFPTSFFWENQITDSASFGIHVGFANAEFSGSLIFGGYDQSRVVGAVSAQPYGSPNSNTTTFGIDLLDISVHTAEGASPFPYSDKNGILRGSDQPKNSLAVQMDHRTPYMYLPRQLCDAITQDLPTAFDPDLGLYLWNASDPQYQKIIRSASYLSFTFRASNSNGNPNITINAPWQLFNLTLTAPLSLTPIPYFPCSPYVPSPQTPCTLGRAFLQSAFLGANWRPLTSDGSWFLAQGPGPNTASTPDVQVIQQNDMTIPGTNTDWKSTWDGYWAPLENSTSPPNSASISKNTTTTITGNNSASSTRNGSNSSLSAGAKTGIGVGTSAAALAVVALVALLLWRRRLRSKKVCAPATPVGDTYNDEKRRGSKVPVDGEQRLTRAQELDGFTTQAEMEGSAPYHELPTNGTPRRCRSSGSLTGRGSCAVPYVGQTGLRRPRI